MKNTIAILSTIVVLLGCASETSDTDFQSLKGVEYTFKANLVSNHPEVQFPADMLDESDFTVTTDGPEYSIAFSVDLQTLTLEPGAISGTLQDMGDVKLVYSLDKGLFAGGRILVWKAGNSFEAEYTVFGSGVPIIKSERGVLKPVE